MLLKDLGVSLAVPPVSFLALALAGFALRRRRAGRVLLGGGLCGLLLLAMPVTGDALLVSLETSLPLVPPPGEAPAAIVVLSAEAARARDAAPAFSPGRLTLERLRAGAALARRTGLPLLVSGGAPQPGDEPLADTMARSLAEDFQEPARWTETRSLDTWENATLSGAILRGAGIHSIYLVTHAWHERRAVLAFARQGLLVTAAPVRLDARTGRHLADWVPHASGWLTSYLALHEWIGYAWYAYAHG